MSRIMSAVQEMYDISDRKGWDNELASNKVSAFVEACAGANNFHLLNNVLYNLDLNKVYIDVAWLLVFYTYKHAHELSMRGQFIEQCREHYRGHARRSEYFFNQYADKPSRT